ncbi:unnamed protein product [Arabis nemorensis]|uniref:Neprosin domain-containing protein n=1 Tax=Arabis nemorensis TaxID=586526 RepID=A0A565CH02_9BRAS|nr:unnamed protein product [Arabis nemorensis]
MGNGVNIAGVGGAVVSSPSGISPPMGTEKFKRVTKSMLETILDSDKCYGVKWGKQYLFTFGGPGGDSC